MSIVEAQIISQPQHFKEDDLHTFLEKRRGRLGMISSKRMIENTLQIYLQRYKKQKNYYIEFRKPIHELNDELNLSLDKMRIDEDDSLSSQQLQATQQPQATQHNQQNSKSTLLPVPQAPNLQDPTWLSFQQRSIRIEQDKEDDKQWLEMRKAKSNEDPNFPKSNWANSRLRRL